MGVQCIASHVLVVITSVSRLIQLNKCLKSVSKIVYSTLKLRIVLKYNLFSIRNRYKTNVSICSPQGNRSTYTKCIKYYILELKREGRYLMFKL